VTLRASTNVQGECFCNASNFNHIDMKNIADLFESYIGGLYVDQGLDAVKPWLNSLFRPYAKLAYSVVRTQHIVSPSPPTPSSTPPLDVAGLTLSEPTTSGHLSLFNQHIQKAEKTVEWVYSGGSSNESKRTTPVWGVKVMVDGECLGQGKGLSKKAARNEAAKQGLEGLGVYV